MSSTVEQIKERLAITDVVSSYVRLEKAGVNLKARCPFHNEKTPSFFISPQRNTYHCFGCGKGGDIFSFIQEIEGIDFRESLHLLAERAGVVVKESDWRERNEKKRLYDILEAAAAYFEVELAKNKDALIYLNKRGLQKEAMQSFRIGFAPQEWRALTPFLRRNGFSDEEIMKVGLAIPSERGADSYDRFRGRIMFPILDHNERIVAFSGRIFSRDGDVQNKNSGGKYINSPETLLFNKSRILYAFEKAKSHIRSENSCILVEGQMDAIMSHQDGVKNVVAVSGTALTSEHLSLLGRMTDNLIFAFDADVAGIHASRRGIDAALASGFAVRILKLPEGSDPADFIKTYGDKWKILARDSKHIVDFFLSVLVEEISDKHKLGKQIEKYVLPYIAKIKSTMERAHFVSRVASFLAISEEPIWESIGKIEKENAQVYITPTLKIENGVDNETKAGNVSNFYEDQYRNLEERLLSLLLLWGKQGEEKNLLDEVHKDFEEITGVSLRERLKQFKVTEADEVLFEAEAHHKDSNLLRKELDELLLNLKEHILKGQLLKAMDELRYAEDNHDENRAHENLKLCKKLGGEINKLSSLRIKS